MTPAEFIAEAERRLAALPPWNPDLGDDVATPSRSQARREILEYDSPGEPMRFGRRIR